MKLSEHFDLNEFTRSATADRLHIDNSLNPSDPIGQSIINNLKNLCQQVLEPLREHFGIPIVVSSGYRCPALNQAVGGVPNSQHLTGEAADIVMSNLTEAFHWFIDNVPFDQIGWEQTGSTRWIHVSCKPDPKANRQCIFRKKK